MTHSLCFAPAMERRDWKIPLMVTSDRVTSARLTSDQVTSELVTQSSIKNHRALPTSQDGNELLWDEL